MGRGGVDVLWDLSGFEWWMCGKAELFIHKV